MFASVSAACVLPKGGQGGCGVGGALGQSHPCHVTVRGRQLGHIT